MSHKNSWKSPQRYIWEAERSNRSAVRIRISSRKLHEHAIRFRDMKKFQGDDVEDLKAQKKALIETVATLDEVLSDVLLLFQFEHERKERIAKRLQHLCKFFKIHKGSKVEALPDSARVEYEILRWVLDGAHGAR